MAETCGQNHAPSFEDLSNVVFARVMDAVNEVLNQTIDEFKETMRSEVHKETQTLVAFAKKELEAVEARVAGQIDKLKTEALQEMKSTSAQAASQLSRVPKQVQEGIEAGMVEITCTVEKYKKHIELAGDRLATFDARMDALKKEIGTASGFVRNLVERGYSPEVIEKQMRDRVTDIAALQGQINGMRGHRNGRR